MNPRFTVDEHAQLDEHTVQVDVGRVDSERCYRLRVELCAVHGKPVATLVSFGELAFNELLDQLTDEERSEVEWFVERSCEVASLLDAASESAGDEYADERRVA